MQNRRNSKRRGNTVFFIFLSSKNTYTLIVAPRYSIVNKYPKKKSDLRKNRSFMMNEKLFCSKGNDGVLSCSAAGRHNSGDESQSYAEQNEKNCVACRKGGNARIVN